MRSTETLASASAGQRLGCSLSRAGNNYRRNIQPHGDSSVSAEGAAQMGWRRWGVRCEPRGAGRNRRDRGLDSIGAKGLGYSDPSKSLQRKRTSGSAVLSLTPTPRTSAGEAVAAVAAGRLRGHGPVHVQSGGGARAMAAAQAQSGPVLRGVRAAGVLDSQRAHPPSASQPHSHNPVYSTLEGDDQIHTPRPPERRTDTALVSYSPCCRQSARKLAMITTPPRRAQSSRKSDAVPVR